MTRKNRIFITGINGSPELEYRLICLERLGDSNRYAEVSDDIKNVNVIYSNLLLMAYQYEDIEDEEERMKLKNEIHDFVDTAIDNLTDPHLKSVINLLVYG